MASDFLDNLKKAVDTGNFNSEAAKKIIEVNELADTKNSTKKLDEILDNNAIKTVTEEEAAIIKSDYDKKMQEIKEKDLILQQIKTLMDIEEQVMLSIQDMRDFIQTLEQSFDVNNPIHVNLFIEIAKIKSKYNSIINN